jgi:hypothetical protein
MTSSKYGVIAAFILACLWAQAALVINEVCYDNSSLADETGDTGSDWIELYNSGPDAVNVNGYGLGDANPYEEGKGVRLPNCTIPAGGYLVVFANSDIPDRTAWTNAPDVALIPSNSVWRYLVTASAPAATWKTNAFDDTTWATGQSPLGYNDPTLSLDCATTLGYGGNPSARYITSYFRKSVFVLNAAAVTGLVMNARVNDGMVVYLNGREALRYNLPAGTVTGSTLASASLSSRLWTSALLATNGLIQGTNVVAVEVHQASASSPDLILDLSLTALVNAQVPVVHGQFGLSKEGENVHLFNASLARIQKFDYAIGVPLPGENQTYGAYPDGSISAFKVYAKPTPGLPNATHTPTYSELPTLPKPRFSVAPGVYATNRAVAVTSATNGYSILCTRDGSDPRSSATALSFASGQSVTVSNLPPATSGLAWVRTNPVEISNSVPSAAWLPPSGSVAKVMVLRAVAVSADGKYCSPETRGTYFVGPAFTNRTLPAVSVTANTNDLFGFVSGLFVPGKTYADSPEGYGANKWGKPYANYHLDSDTQAWERPVCVELIETQQTAAAVSVPLGVAMHGGGTRAIPQKTLYLMARNAEYGTGRVDYALFPDEPATAYKRFLLRNSGNDWYGPDTGVPTMLKDAVLHRLVKNLNLSVMAYRPTVAYVNGEYWGLHNLRESFDKHYLATRYGLDADTCDLLMHEEDPLNKDKVKIVRIDGDKAADEDYGVLLNWVNDNGLSSPANYQYLQTRIDVTNYTDYIIAETFFANTDWPINNCDFWRAHTNQVATSGAYGDTRWRWMLYDLDVAGEKGAAFNMFSYLSDSDMTGRTEPAFLINKLWENTQFRALFATRYANLLNTTFRPERMAGVITQAAAAIAPEVETHFRRWGRAFSQAQWQQSVDTALVQYTATRHSVSWTQLNAHLSLNGTGQLTVRNSRANGAGGRFMVNGMVIDTTTDGVTNRAAWTGTYFRNLTTTVQAVPDPGSVFVGWVGTEITADTRVLSVGSSPVTLTGLFRSASPTDYERWQTENYTDVEILNGVSAEPSAPSGCAGLSNFALYAFGMRRTDGLTDAQRLARVSLSINSRSNALWVGYARLNSSFGGVRYTLKTTPGLHAPVVWSDAVTGTDLDPVSLTNTLDASTWRYEVRLPAASPARDARFFKLEAAQP